jgi:hypothetical protein
MKKIFLICILSFICLFGKAQKFSLQTNTIWNALYPRENDFDNYYQLIRKVSEDGRPKEYRTAIQNTFYYKSGNIDKAAVILFSYEYVNGQKLDGHASTPKIDVVTFVISNSNWVKRKIVEDWKIPQPGFGEGPKFHFKKLNNINCIFSTFDAFYNGKGNYSVTEYYNVETLKKVKSTSTKISD